MNNQLNEEFDVEMDTNENPNKINQENGNPMLQLSYNSQFQKRILDIPLEKTKQRVGFGGNQSQNQYFVENLLNNSKKEIFIPSIQRLQRMRIDATQKSLEDKMMVQFEEYLDLYLKNNCFLDISENSKEGHLFKIKTRQVCNNLIELIQKGKCLKIWEKITQTIYQITIKKFNEICQRDLKQNRNQIIQGRSIQQIDDDDNQYKQSLYQITDLWHYLNEVCHDLQKKFQGIELHVQNTQRLKAQIRIDNIGLKRSHMDIQDEKIAELERPGIFKQAKIEIQDEKNLQQDNLFQPSENISSKPPVNNRALQALQMRAKAHGNQQIQQAFEILPEVKEIAEKCENMHEIFIVCVQKFIINQNQGKILIEEAVIEALTQIQNYRGKYLDPYSKYKQDLIENNIIQLDNQHEMYRVKTLMKLAQDCMPYGNDYNKEDKQASLYNQLVEPKLIQKTQHFYEHVQKFQFQNLDINKYIKLVDLIFECEDYLVEQYLDNQSFALINSCVYEFMIKNCQNELLKQGLSVLINNRNYDSIEILYSYMHDTNLVQELQKHWSQYIYEQGLSYLKELTSSRLSVMKVVGLIIDLKILTDSVIEECFQGNESLRNAQIQSFQEFFNRQGHQAKIAQILSLYIDCIMRKDQEQTYKQFKIKSSEDQIMEMYFASDQTLQISNVDIYEHKQQQQLVQLFRFLQAKDIFIQSYITFLSERLLQMQSVGGLQREAFFVQQLKSECGDQFAAQTEQMINDIKLQEELSSAFRDTKSQKVKKKQQWNFLILDSTKWPVKSNDYIIQLPKVLKDVFEEFTQMYEKTKRGNPKQNEKPTKSQKQKDQAKGQNPQAKAIILTWNYQYGDCELQTYTLSDLKREIFVLKVSCIEGIVLLQFNTEFDKKTSKEISKTTEIPIAQCDQIIKKLVKFEILKEVEHLLPLKYKINENFNKGSEFQEKQKYISLMPTAQDIQQEDKQFIEKMELQIFKGDQIMGEDSQNEFQTKFIDNLKYRIDGRIVKILKKTKKMKIQQLIDQVILDLNLQMNLPQSQQQVAELRKQIEKRIEDLAMRVFLKINNPSPSDFEFDESYAEYVHI